MDWHPYRFTFTEYFFCVNIVCEEFNSLCWLSVSAAVMVLIGSATQLLSNEDREEDHGFVCIEHMQLAKRNMLTSFGCCLLDHSTQHRRSHRQILILSFLFPMWIKYIYAYTSHIVRDQNISGRKMNETINKYYNHNTYTIILYERELSYWNLMIMSTLACIQCFLYYQRTHIYSNNYM